MRSDTRTHGHPDGLWMADTIVGWQNAVGGIDVDRCIYHAMTPLGKPSAYGQDVPWLARALYRAFEHTGEPRYKDAADRYSVYFVATMFSGAPTFALGDALDPCLSEYRRHNPHDDSLDDKARTILEWIVGRRSSHGHVFDVGYPWRDDTGEYREGSDAAFSNDLSDVGRGLVWFAQQFDDRVAADNAESLASYFTTDYAPGSVNGVWSPSQGTWLIGPHPAKGFENVDRYANDVGWGWTNYYAAHYLMRLHDAVDAELSKRIEQCCVSAVRWVFDTCQFDDGAVGMCGRDDKWLGMTGLAILLYAEVRARGWLDPATEATYGLRARLAHSWLVDHAATRARWPKDGYLAVSGATGPEPAWNTSWMLGITLEAVLAGSDLGAARSS